MLFSCDSPKIWVFLFLMFFLACGCNHRNLGQEKKAGQTSSDRGSEGDGGDNIPKSSSETEGKRKNPLEHKLEAAKEKLAAAETRYGKKKDLEKSVNSAQSVLDLFKDAKKLETIETALEESINSHVFTPFSSADKPIFQKKINHLKNYHQISQKQQDEIGRIFDLIKNTIPEKYRARHGATESDLNNLKNGIKLLKGYADEKIGSMRNDGWKTVPEDQIEEIEKKLNDILKNYEDPFLEKYKFLVNEWLDYNNRQLKVLKDADTEVKELSEQIYA